MWTLTSFSDSIPHHLKSCRVNKISGSMYTSVGLVPRRTSTTSYAIKSRQEAVGTLGYIRVSS